MNLNKRTILEDFVVTKEMFSKLALSFHSSNYKNPINVRQFIKNDMLNLELENGVSFVLNFPIVLTKEIWFSSFGAKREEMIFNSLEQLLLLNRFLVFSDKNLVCEIDNTYIENLDSSKLKTKKHMSLDNKVSVNCNSDYVDIVIPYSAFTIKNDCIKPQIFEGKSRVLSFFVNDKVCFKISGATINNDGYQTSVDMQITDVHCCKVNEIALNCSRKNALIAGNNILGLSNVKMGISKNDISEATLNCDSEIQYTFFKDVLARMKFNDSLELNKKHQVLLDIDNNSKIKGFDIAQKQDNDFIVLRAQDHNYKKGTSEDLEVAEKKQREQEIEQTKQYIKELQEKIEKTKKEQEIANEEIRQYRTILTGMRR